MTISSPFLPILGVILCMILLLVRGVIGTLWKILFRSGCSILFLALLSRIPMFSGIVPGANPISALVLGVLGVPGFALLLLVRWLLQ